MFRIIKANNDINKNVRKVFWLFFIMFFILCLYFLKQGFLDADRIRTNSYNRRMTLISNDIVRGYIYDINKTVLAENNENGERVYPYNNILSHVVGYTVEGMAGAESKFNFGLQNMHFEFRQRLENVIFDEKLYGNSIVLTVDAEISSKITNLIEGKKGAVVVMDTKTGGIITSVSYPNFDSNQIVKNWSKLSNDENSPLINRAFQGLYPPASTFKIITALCAIDNLPDYGSLKYTCAGSAEFDGKVIHCYGDKAHGEVGIMEAFAQSCNTFFADLAIQMGSEKINVSAEKFLFNQNLNFELEHRNSTIKLSNISSVSEIVETAIGQGQTTATPLEMALVAQTVANGGIMMKPYVLNAIENGQGNAVNKTLPKSEGQIISYSAAEELKKMMIACVESGTGKGTGITGAVIGAKTGTAENPHGKDHSWYIGFYEKNNYSFTISVLLENSGTNASTAIAGKIFKILDEYVKSRQ